MQWGLTHTLMVVIGVCSLASAFVGILHAENTPKIHEQESGSSAFHQAMTTFVVGNVDEKPKMATLSCQAHGGPSDEHAQEMVYWQDIPSDTHFVSPFRAKHGKEEKRYLTFEPDGGGWNNIRMAMETVVGLAIAMGRTLVLPPEQGMVSLQEFYDFNKNKTRVHSINKMIFCRDLTFSISLCCTVSLEDGPRVSENRFWFC